jgi:rhamnosyl/mannosyltransferase
MRVLHVYRTYLPDTYGGLEQTIRQIALGTTRRGIENQIVYVGTGGQRSEIRRPEGSVHRFPQTFEISSMNVSFALLRDYSKLAKQADLVHYHFPWPFGDVLHMYGAHEQPAVVTYHSDIVRQTFLARIYAPLMRRFLGRMRALVATSPNYLRTSSVLCEHAAKTAIIPIGLDETSYPPVDPRRVDHWRQVLGEGFFLFVGVLRYYKGLQFLVDALRDTELRAVVVGAGPMDTMLRRKVQSEAVHNLKFVGYLPDEDKVALLSLCSAVVLPSHLRTEAFGVSLVEGAMFAKPLISCEIGTGTSYVNIGGETGVVVPPEDALALRNAMHQLASNPQRARALGHNARARYESLFTAQRMADQYAELYKAVLSGDRTRAVC